MAKRCPLTIIKSALEVLEKSKDNSKLTPKQLSAAARVVCDMNAVLSAQKTTKELQKSLDKFNKALKETYDEAK